MRNSIKNGYTEASTYRFNKLSTSLFVQDLCFLKSDAKPGTSVENVKIERLDGSPITLEEAMDGCPTLLVFGSVSCPMTFGSIDVLRRLHDDFSNTIKIIMLNVREAHPGEYLEQPQMQQDKREHANLLASETEAPWEVLVDTIDGELHRVLAEKPNAAFLLAPTRNILFRSLWASDENALRVAMSSVSSGTSMKKNQSSSMIGPLVIGLGYFAPILNRSGSRAKRELLFAAPPVALIAGLASILRPLPISRRGTAAIAVMISLFLFTAFVIAANR